MKKEIFVKVLVEDRPGPVENEHGLSLYVQYRSRNILLDTGASELFLKNAKALDVDLEDIDYCIISHGHYDHGRCMNNLPEDTNIIINRDCFLPRYRKSHRNLSGGIDQNYYHLCERYNVIANNYLYRITHKIYYLSNIKERYSFECNDFPMLYLLDDSVDRVPEESILMMKKEEGLVIFSSCSHKGICNIIAHVHDLFDEPIYAIVGGLHLKEINEQTKHTIEFLRNCEVQRLYLGHCTSDQVIEYMKDELKDKDIESLYSGKCFTI